MTRLRLPLSVITTIAMVSGALLLGSSVLASPCPFGVFSSAGEVGGSRNPKGSDRANDSDRTGGFDRVSGSGDSFRQSDCFHSGSNASFASNAKPLTLTEAEVAGFGAILGLFTIALFYKVRYGRKLVPGEVDLLSKYPFLEHPEMVLALVPQEALSSPFETEVITTRR